MKRITLLAQALIVGVLLGAGSMTATAASGPGECGEYMYWHAGHCVDARAKPSSVSWMKSVF
jgi:hypothetical protein